MSNEGKRELSRKAIGAIGSGVGVVLIFVLVFTPMISVSYEEMVTKQRPEIITTYEERIEDHVEIETRQEPQTVLEPKSETPMSLESTTINPGENAGGTVYIESGRSVELLMDASDTLRTYVMSKSEYEANSNEFSPPISEEKSVRYGFIAPISDTYYIRFYNHHEGLFGIDDTTVGLFSATLTTRWEEKVTRIVPVDVPVTISTIVEYPVQTTVMVDYEEPVTKTKTLSVVDMLMGK